MIVREMRMITLLRQQEQTREKKDNGDDDNDKKWSNKIAFYSLLFWSVVITGENYVGLAADVWDFGEMREIITMQKV